MNIQPRAVVRIAAVQAAALARIARAYEQHVSGRCDAARVLEIVRQELQRVDRETTRARRRVA